MSSTVTKWGKGEADSGKQTVIRFEEGLIGFSSSKSFVLTESESIAPFRVLRSTDNPDLAFLVLDPSIVVKDYSHLISSRDWESVQAEDPSEQAILAVCTVGEKPSDSRGNFQAPIIFNRRKMIGRQVILVESGLSARHPLL
jgi:flagellar assembly factor FliW